MSAEEYDSWQATLELYEDPEAQREIEESRQGFLQGESTSLAEMKELLEQRRNREGAA